MTYEYQNSHDGTAHLAFLRGDRRLMPGWYARMSSTNLKMVFANWMSRACAELNRLAGHFKQRDTMYHQFDRRRWLGFIISSSASTDVLKFASPTFGNTFAFEVAMSTHCSIAIRLLKSRRQIQLLLQKFHNILLLWFRQLVLLNASDLRFCS